MKTQNLILEKKVFVQKNCPVPKKPVKIENGLMSVVKYGSELVVKRGEGGGAKKVPGARSA